MIEHRRQQIFIYFIRKNRAVIVVFAKKKGTHGKKKIFFWLKIKNLAAKLEREKDSYKRLVVGE